MAPKTTRRRGLPWPRRLLFLSILLVAFYGLLEVCSLLVFSLKFEEGYSFQRMADEKAEVARSVLATPDAKRSGAFQDNRVFHPYLGHVYKPDSPVLFDDVETPVAALFDETCKTNRLGHFGPVPSELKKTSVKVLITGGSLANLVYCYSRGALVKQLKRVPAFRGRPIQVIGMALCGYRQPQQLMALNYLAVHGHSPDIVINLDGFNEVATHDFKEDADNAEYPLYPHMWSAYFPDYSSQVLEMIGAIAQHKRARGRWAESASAVSFSVTGNLIWALRDLALQHEIARLRGAINDRRKGADAYSFNRFGPRIRIRSFKSLTRINAQTWYHASLQMHRIARGGGGAYFHFLQPNLHVPDSKPHSEKEKSYLETGSWMGKRVRLGYPMLRRYGRSLRARGVQFHDLSFLFKGHAGTLSADDCCHYSRQGDGLIAGEIGRIIADRLSSPRPEAGAGPGGSGE